MATQDEIKKYLKGHTYICNGYDLINGQFPLPVTIGEGFEFSIKGKQYITQAKRENGKRKIIFRITSFENLYNGDIKYYYCKAYSYISNVDKEQPSASISGYLDGIEVPVENRTLEFAIGIPLTKKMKEEDYGHYKYNEIGDCASILTEKKLIYDVIEYLKDNVFDMHEWVFEIEDRLKNKHTIIC